MEGSTVTSKTKYCITKNNKPTRIRTVWVAKGQSFTLSPDELDSLLTKINAPALQCTDEPKLIDVVVTIKPLVCA